jgi:DNA-binding CsgD family transcriptional regulator
VLIGFHCFDLMLWSLLADLSYRFHVSPILAFGLGRSVLHFANCLGTCLGIFIRLTMGNHLDFVSLSIISATITMLLFVTFTFILPEKALFDFRGVEKDGKPGSIMQACGKVAERYSLSPREESVMRLVVKGRSIARIQEELYMSKGTVNTHLYHIYQKLNIHTKQNLLDLVENDLDIPAGIERASSPPPPPHT